MAPADPAKINQDGQSVDEAPADTIQDADEKALVRRIDLLLMPAIWVMYLFSYADRTK